jgi:hypothetical protein
MRDVIRLMPRKEQNVIGIGDDGLPAGHLGEQARANDDNRVTAGVLFGAGIVVEARTVNVAHH